MTAPGVMGKLDRRPANKGAPSRPAQSRSGHSSALYRRSGHACQPHLPASMVSPRFLQVVREWGTPQGLTSGLLSMAPLNGSCLADQRGALRFQPGHLADKKEDPGGQRCMEHSSNEASGSWNGSRPTKVISTEGHGFTMGSRISRRKKAQTLPHQSTRSGVRDARVAEGGERVQTIVQGLLKGWMADCRTLAEGPPETHMYCKRSHLSIPGGSGSPIPGGPLPALHACGERHLLDSSMEVLHSLERAR